MIQSPQINLIRFTLRCGIAVNKEVTMTKITPMMHNLKLIENTEPALRYRGDLDFADWQSKARAKLKDLLGMHRIQKPQSPDFRTEYIKEEKEYTEYRFLVESEPGYYVPCVMLVPKNIPLPVPTMICLQGHSTGMHISLARPIHPEDEGDIKDGDRDFAIRAVKEGCIAVAVEQRNFGECGANPNGSPDCHISSMTAILMGRTTIGERVHDVSCVIDALLTHFDCADPDHIMLLGNSGGGTATIYAAAVDERISVAVPSCSVCTYKASIAAMHHCVCNFVPEIANYFDMGELGGLVAPRGLVVVNGRHDSIFPEPGVQEAYSIIRNLYEAAGAPSRCRLVTGEGGHRFYADAAWPHIHELAGK